MPYAITIQYNGRTSWRSVESGNDILPNESFSLVIPGKTLADASIELMSDVQAWLDDTTRKNGYDSCASCISYRGSSVAQWNADAVAALAWRDAVWKACFQWQQDAKANPPEVFPTSEQVISQLPQPESFGWINHQPGQS